MDLDTLLDKKLCECLNEADDHPYEHALTSGGGYLESDCDEQLILSLAFNQVQVEILICVTQSYSEQCDLDRLSTVHILIHAGCQSSLDQGEGAGGQGSQEHSHFHEPAKHTRLRQCRINGSNARSHVSYKIYKKSCESVGCVGFVRFYRRAAASLMLL